MLVRNVRRHPGEDLQRIDRIGPRRRPVRLVGAVAHLAPRAPLGCPRSSAPGGARRRRRHRARARRRAHESPSVARPASAWASSSSNSPRRTKSRRTARQNLLSRPPCRAPATPQRCRQAGSRHRSQPYECAGVSSRGRRASEPRRIRKECRGSRTRATGTHGGPTAPLRHGPPAQPVNDVLRKTCVMPGNRMVHSHGLAC